MQQRRFILKSKEIKKQKNKSSIKFIGKFSKKINLKSKNPKTQNHNYNLNNLNYSKKILKNTQIPNLKMNPKSKKNFQKKKKIKKIKKF